MKKNFRFYTIIWAILLISFNAVIFFAHPVFSGYEIHYDGRFWIAWAFILVAFIGNLACSCIAFQAKNLQKAFYNISLVTISYSGAILLLILGFIAMLIPNFPAWITAAVCILILAFHSITIVKTAWAVDAVNAVDEKVKTQTQFIRTATSDAETLMNRAKSLEAKAQCKKVYEALRYSDPVSSEALSAVEVKITAKINELAIVINEDHSEQAVNITNEIIFLLSERNSKYKKLK